MSKNRMNLMNWRRIAHAAMMCGALFAIVCCWCSAAMAQLERESSAPQVRVRVFLEAPLGTAAAAPLAVRIVARGPVLQLLDRGPEATTQVQVVIETTNSPAELTMTISVDDAEVVAVPNAPIAIATVGGMMRHTVPVELTAKRVGEAVVTVKVSDGGNEATAPLRIEVTEGAEVMEQPDLVVIEPQTDTVFVLRLLSGEPETTQVQVIIDAIDTASTLRMTLFVDDVGAEFVDISSDTIVIAPQSGATLRSAQFGLTAKKAGTAMISVAVTDGVSTVTVALRVIVVADSQVTVIEPTADTILQLLSRGDEATTQVEVVIDVANAATDLRMTVSADDAEVVSVPSAPIPITAVGDAIRRSAQFELTAKRAGTVMISIAVTDGVSTDTVVLRVIVEDSQIEIKPQVDAAFVLRLPSGEPETTTQIQVVIETDTTAELTMTVSVDDAEVVSVSGAPILVTAVGDAARRSAQFELTAKKAGTVMISIAVTDGASTTTVALRVVIAEPRHTLVVIEPQTDAVLRLLSSGAEATAQVPVVIEATNSAAELRMMISVDTEVVSVPIAPILIAAVGDVTRRSTQFELTAKRAGTAMISIAVTDGVSTDTVVLRVIVEDSQIEIKPQVDAVFVLRLPSGEPETTTQIQVVIETDTTAELTMTVSADNAEVVSVPIAPILIAAAGDVTRRSAQFELTAKRAGTAMISIAVTDGASTATVALRVVIAEPRHTLVVIEPQADAVLRLLSSGAETTTQIQVVIETDTTAELTMTVSADNAEVVSVPIAPILIAAAGDVTRRSAQFELTAKRAGTAMISIAVTDGASTATVALRVVIEEPRHTLVVIEPQTDAVLRLLSRGAEATAQVPVVIEATNSAAELRMMISVDTKVVSVPIAPIVIAPQPGTMQRSTQFELTAKRTGMATVMITVTDGASTATVALRVVVENAQIEIEPQVDDAFILELLSGEPETTQVQVVIETNTTAELMMTVSVDSAGAEVVSVPSSPIIIAAAGNAMQRSAQFELTAKRGGLAMISIAVTDGASTATVTIALRVIMPHILSVIEPRANTVLQLLSRGDKSTTQVPVVIEATNSAAGLRIAISVDPAGAEVVSIPSAPIIIPAEGNATRRSTQFELIAKNTGMATVTIAVTDGDNFDTVVLTVLVPTSLQILSPSDGTVFNLVRGDGSAAVTPMELLITQLDTEVPITLDLQLDSDTVSPVLVSPTSLILAASDDGSARAQFMLAAEEAGNTMLTIVARDILGSRAAVAVRVAVTRVKELCETCLIPDRVIVPKGSFSMGSSSSDPSRNVAEKPQHRVDIDYDLVVGKYELTRGQYRTFAEATEYDVGNGRGSWRYTGLAQAQTEAHPVVNVSWDDAKAYLSWLSQMTAQEWRLLSEAEWEYAARAGTTTFYSFGNGISAARANYWPSNTTVAVGSYDANAFGLYDIHGNVWELVEDCWHHDYTNAPTDGSVWNSDCAGAGSHVMRSGSWLSPYGDLQSSYRFRYDSGTRYNTIGFRVARKLIDRTDPGLQNILAVVEPTVGTVLRLLSSGVEAVSQVQVLVDAMDTAAELRMTVSVDNAEVVTVPSAPIIIAPQSNVLRRSTQFELTANTVGTAMLRIAVTDGASTATVALTVIVEDPQIEIKPQVDTAFVLRLPSGETEATTQVQLVIETNIAAEFTMTVSVDDAEVATVPAVPIVVAATGDATRRSVQFELTAKKAGTATVTIAVTDGASTAMATLRAIVVADSQIAVIEPQADTVLRLLSSGVEAMAQVHVAAEVANRAAGMTITVSVDNSDVVSVPSAPIVVAADGDATRRSTQFGLTAKKAGTAMVMITMTDGVHTNMVTLSVVVEDPPILRILSPSDGTRFNLVRGDGSLAARQVEILITQTNTDVPVTLNLQLDSSAMMSPVLISTTSLILTVSDSGTVRTQFTLAAVEAGNATLRLVASNSVGNRVVVAVRVAVRRVAKVCETCLVPDMVLVSTGSFMMGSPVGAPDRDREREPRHRVTIDYPFAVGTYELTRGQFRAFSDATGYYVGDLWNDPGIAQTDKHPVVYVTWHEAKAYLSWLSEMTGQKWRLLSEAEWEYAARAGTTTLYSFGDTIRCGTQANCVYSNGTVTVGLYPANAFGLHDMHGNVREWVEDCWHRNYTGAPTDGSAWVSDCDEQDRIMRGGAWSRRPANRKDFLFFLRALRSDYRVRIGPRNHSVSTGFRVARTISP